MRRDHQETLDRQVCLATKAHKARLETLGSLDLKVPVADPDPLVLLDPLVSLGEGDREDLLERQGNLVKLADKDLQDHAERGDLW